MHFSLVYVVYDRWRRNTAKSIESATYFTTDGKQKVNSDSDQLPNRFNFQFQTREEKKAPFWLSQKLPYILI